MAKSKNNAIITLTDGERVEIRIKPVLLDALVQMVEDEGMDYGEMVNYALSYYAECVLGFDHKYVKAPLPQKRDVVSAVVRAVSIQPKAKISENGSGEPATRRFGSFNYDPDQDSIDAQIQYLDPDRAV